MTDTKITMSDELAAKVSRFTQFEKRFCEGRSKGLNQTEAAKYAGSTAEGSSLSRVGYNTAQKDGIEDYISYLTRKRADAALVDSTEIIEKFRTVYDEAMIAGKFGDANKALEHLATMAGLLGNKGQGNSAHSSSGDVPSKNDTSAFKENKEGLDLDERLKQVKNLLRDTE